MSKVTVGFQDGGLHPLWLANAGLRIGRLLGAESLWLPDHYMGFVSALTWKPENTAAAKVVHSPDGFFDPLQILAVTASRMRGVDVGTLVTEPYRRHPMSIAQSFATLDHISKGHAILGIGNGERENVEPYGMPWNKQVSRLEEALTIIRLLWDSQGTPVNFDGKFWTLRDAVFNLPLFEGKHPRIWIASHAPRMLGLTGRFGDGWVPTLKCTPEVYAERLRTILDAGRAAGRNMDHFVAGIAAPCALGSSREQVVELAMKNPVAHSLSLLVPAEVWKAHGKTHPLGDNFKGFTEIVPPRVTQDHLEHAREQLVPEILLESMYAGSPEEIRDELAPVAAAGCRHMIIANIGAAFTGGGPGDLWRLGSLIRKLRRL